MKGKESENEMNEKEGNKRKSNRNNFIVHNQHHMSQKVKTFKYNILNATKNTSLNTNL